MKTLIRLGRCPGSSESSLGTQSFCSFCHKATLFFGMISFVYFRDSFSTMSQGEKIRSVSKLLEQLVDAVSNFL